MTALRPTAKASALSAAWCRLAGTGLFLAGFAQALAATTPEEAYELGRAALRQREFAVAVTHFEQAVADRPETTGYHVWLGNACAWMAATVPTPAKPRWGRRSLASYRRALELDPDNVDAHFSLMNFYRHVPAFLGGGLARAWAQAAEIERRDPARGAHARALLLEQEGRATEALQVLLDAASSHPNDFGLSFTLGRLAVRSGRNLSEAESALNRCLELAPTGSLEGRDEARALLLELTQLRRSELPVACDLCPNPSYDKTLGKRAGGGHEAGYHARR